MFTPQIDVPARDCIRRPIADGTRVGGLVTALIAAALLAGCDSGPSDSEWVAACLKEGERGANKMMRKEMGVKSGEEFCKCGAAAAKASLSSDARRALILNMQGKTQEAQAITSKMSDADQDTAMKGAMTIFGKCSGMMR